MSNSTALSFDQLLLEILYGILHYLDIPDILRLRKVSRCLNEISHCRDVWSDAYRKADFVLPPGPFLSQSIHDLENALIPSYRVDRNLRDGGGTAQREKPTRKLREIRYTGVDLHVSLVFGRFLFIALSEEVRCYDLNLDAFDSNSGASIIYRSIGGGTLTSFHCVSAIDVEGRPFACAVLSEEMRTGSSAQVTTQISIYSLNVEEQSPAEVTLDLLCQFEHDVFDIDLVDVGPRVIAIHGRVGGLLDSDWRLVALDVHTPTQFLLPSFVKAMWETPGIPEWPTLEDLSSPTSISTSTHLLLAMSFYTQSTGWSTFIQAFTLPHPSTHRRFTPTSTPLSPSHSSIVPGINLRDRVLLHDAILDPTTQDVLITIRVYAFEPSRPRTPLSRYGILRLGSTAHSTSRGGVGTVVFQLLGPLGQLARTPFLHPSFNGTGRALYMFEPRIVAALEYDVRGGGGGDNEPEPEAKVVEYPSILRFPTPRTLLDYDPYSGRICLRSAMAKYSVIEILDLSV